MNHYQFSAPPLTKMNKIILISTGACFLLFSILKAVGAFNLVSVLGLSASDLVRGHVYQLITYPLVETGLMGFVFNSLIIWFIGSELEGQWGSKIYLRFLLINVVVVGLIYSILNVALFYGTQAYFGSLHGLSGINFAMLASYAILYPDRQMAFMMIFPMKSRTFCLILAAIEAYLALFSDLTSSWAHLLAMVISYFVIKFQGRPLLKKILQSDFRSKKTTRGHLYVVKDEDQKPPKFWQ
jgi:membrane associated rhomboid family serine protease